MHDCGICQPLNFPCSPEAEQTCPPNCLRSGHWLWWIGTEVCLHCRRVIQEFTPWLVGTIWHPTDSYNPAPYVSSRNRFRSYAHWDCQAHLISLGKMEFLCLRRDSLTRHYLSRRAHVVPLVPSRLEQVTVNRAGSPGPQPSSSPGYSPQSVLGCAEEAITDTGGLAFVSSLPAYNYPTVNQSYPEGPFSATILPHPIATESQVAVFPPNWHKIPREAYDRSASSSLPPPVPPPQTATSPPPNWHKIPQEVYDRGRKQWDYTPSECISFEVNGSPGINMGDALRKRFTDLGGRDDIVPQDAGGIISFRLSVRLF